MRTDDNLREICDQLRQSCGDFHASCRRAGLSTDFVVRWMKDDKEAASQIEEAQRIGWMGLESEAIRRAVTGVEKGVYYKGEKVDTEIQYSDTLLAKLLEARVSAYNKKEGSTNTFNGPTQINIMPRAETYEQWLEMKQATLTRNDEKPALPAPSVQIPEILQGEYVEVPVNPMSCLEGIL